MFNLGLEKAEEPESKLPIFIGSWRKHGSSRKTSTSASLPMLKPLTCVDHNKLWKIQEMGILPCLLRNLYVGQEATVRTGYGKTDWYKIWKGVQQDCMLSPCLTSTQCTSCQVLVWMNHKLESRFLGEISITSDMQINFLMAEKQGGTKEPPDDSERGR